MAVKPSSKRRFRAIAARTVVGVIGFILSPLSWWNDLVVNFPLSYAFAWLVGRFLTLFMPVQRGLFIQLFIVGYFLTNLAGFLMIHYSIFGLKKGKKGSLKTQILVSLGYTAAVLAFFGLNICNPDEGCNIFPSWVK